MDQKASSADAHQHKKRKIDDETPCSDILLVSVGPDQELFVVHLDKLTNASELFRQILQKAKTEANLTPEPEAQIDYTINSCNGSYKIHLPGVTSEAFKYVRQYLYSRKLTVNTPMTSGTAVASDPGPDLTWDHIFSVYDFALRCSIPGLQNAAVDASIAKYERQPLDFPTATQINRLYAADLTSLKVVRFRLFFVHMLTIESMSWSSNDSIVNSHDPGWLSQYHPNFLSTIVSQFDKYAALVNKVLRPQPKTTTNGEAPSASGEREAPLKLDREDYVVQANPEPLVMN